MACYFRRVPRSLTVRWRTNRRCSHCSGFDGCGTCLGIGQMGPGRSACRHAGGSECPRDLGAVCRGVHVLGSGHRRTRALLWMQEGRSRSHRRRCLGIHPGILGRDVGSCSSHDGAGRGLLALLLLSRLSGREARAWRSPVGCCGIHGRCIGSQRGVVCRERTYAFRMGCDLNRGKERFAAEQHSLPTDPAIALVRRSVSVQ